MNDDFYIGYLSAYPPRLGRFILGCTLALGAVLVGTVMLLATNQQPIESGRFEFGRSEAFQGILHETPVPMLQLTVPSQGSPVRVNLLLVGAGKHGLPEYARGHSGKKVAFNGTLIYQQDKTMIEMNDPDSFNIVGAAAPDEHRGGRASLGQVEVTGELVDTKCYFGVMRPATGKVHRACAVRCLSGGAPPGLLVRDDQGNGAVILLAGAPGQALEYDVQWAARALRVRGQLELQDSLPILRVERIELID